MEKEKGRKVLTILKDGKNETDAVMGTLSIDLDCFYKLECGSLCLVLKETPLGDFLALKPHLTAQDDDIKFGRL